jgi:hypothetical protein
MIGCKPMKGIGLTVSVSQSHAVDRVGLLMAYGISSTAKKSRITDSNYIGRLHLSRDVSIARKGLQPGTYTGVCSDYAQLVTREVTHSMSQIS